MKRSLTTTKNKNNQKMIQHKSHDNTEYKLKGKEKVNKANDQAQTKKLYRPQKCDRSLVYFNM